MAGLVEPRGSMVEKRLRIPVPREATSRYICTPQCFKERNVKYTPINIPASNVRPFPGIRVLALACRVPIAKVGFFTVSVILRPLSLKLPTSAHEIYALQLPL